MIFPSVQSTFITKGEGEKKNAPMAPPVGLFYMHKFDFGPPVVYFFCCYSSLGFYGLKLCVICICFVQIHATLKFQKYIFTTQFSVAMQLRNVQKNSKQEGKICLVSNDAVTLSPIISEHKFDFYSVDFRSKGLIKNKIKCPRLLSSIFIFPPPLFFFSFDESCVYIICA